MTVTGKDNKNEYLSNVSKLEQDEWIYFYFNIMKMIFSDLNLDGRNLTKRKNHY